VTGMTSDTKRDAGARPRWLMFDGTVRSFLAEALLVPTAFILVAYLTRRFGPDGYGLYALTYAIVVAVAWTTTSLLSRATVKLVGDAEDWRPIGAAVLRVYLVCGLVEALALSLGAEPVAALFGEPALAPCLRVFAWELLLSAAVSAHRGIAIAIGLFRLRAAASAIYWITRLALIVLFVELGFSIEGALFGALCASALHLALYRWSVRQAVFTRAGIHARALLTYAQPLAVAALSIGFFGYVDFFATKILGGTMAETGFFGAARNLASGPRVLAISFAPLLLSTLTRVQASGDEDAARGIGRDALRVMFGFLPLVGIAAATAPELVTLLLGNAFAQAVPLLTLLLIAELGLFMVSVSSVIMLAAGQPRLTLHVGVAMLTLAIIGHAIVVPRFGGVGAASVTATFASLGAAASMYLAARAWGLALPGRTFLRGIALIPPFYVIATLPTPGFWVIPKLAVLVALVPLAFALLGEFDADERARLIETVRRTLARDRGA